MSRYLRSSRLTAHLSNRVTNAKDCPDGAAVIVELAFALPILSFFLLGIIEFGMGWREKLTVERAAQAAGRSAASGGNDRLADYSALRSVDSTINGGNNVKVTRVVIWRATSLTGTIPPPCAAGTSMPGVCNVYSADQVNDATLTGFGSTAAVGGTCVGGSWDSSWCPTTRANTPPASDYVGVTVYAEYTTMTKVLGVDAVDFEATGIYHLEPSYVGR